MRAYFEFAKRYLKLPRKKALDALLLTLYFSVLTFLILTFKPGHIIGHLLIFVVPGMYLMVRYHSIRSHAFLVSIVFGLAAGTLLQVVAELNQVWLYEPAFPFFNLNGLPMEAIAWYVMWSGFAICVYSVFFDRRRTKVERRENLKHHAPFLLLGATVFTLTMLLAILNAELFIVEHPYLVFGIPVFFLPLLVVFYLRRHVFNEIYRAALFLSIFALVYEVIGLHVGWWTFPGNFITTIPIGAVSVPLEEIILWVSLGSLSVLAWYEEVEAE